MVSKRTSRTSKTFSGTSLLAIVVLAGSLNSPASAQPLPEKIFAAAESIDGGVVTIVAGDPVFGSADAGVPDAAPTKETPKAKLVQQHAVIVEQSKRAARLDQDLDFIRRKLEQRRLRELDVVAARKGWSCEVEPTGEEIRGWRLWCKLSKKVAR